MQTERETLLQRNKIVYVYFRTYDPNLTNNQTKPICNITVMQRTNNFCSDFYVLAVFLWPSTTNCIGPSIKPKNVKITNGYEINTVSFKGPGRKCPKSIGFC